MADESKQDVTSDENQKTCFVIAPIGIEGTEIRTRSDQLLEYVITPATENHGYNVVRADHINEPGVITNQIIQHIINDDLVIAESNRTQRKCILRISDPSYAKITVYTNYRSRRIYTL